MTLLSKLASDAIYVQNATNLRGVIKAWDRAICDVNVTRGGQVEEFLNVLYLSKVTSLLKAVTDGIGDVKVYDDATKQPSCDITMAYEWARAEDEGK